MRFETCLGAIIKKEKNGVSITSTDINADINDFTEHTILIDNNEIQELINALQEIKAAVKTPNQETIDAFNEDISKLKATTLDELFKDET